MMTLTTTPQQADSGQERARRWLAVLEEEAARRGLPPSPERVGSGS